MKTFQIRNTFNDNLIEAKLDASGNLVVQGIAIIKPLPRGEVYEHLGYFNQLSKELKLPYEPTLNKFKEHRLKLIKSKKGE